MSIFGQPSVTAFGASQPQQTNSLSVQAPSQQSSNPFGLATTQEKPNPFAAFGASSGTSQSQQSNGTFGGQGSQQQSNNPFASFTSQAKPNPFAAFGASSGTSQPQQASSIFGGTSQPQSTSNIFGSGTQAQQTGSLFGSTSQPQQNTSNFFNGLGASTQQQQSQGGSIFGGNQALQQNIGTGLTLGQSSQQPLSGSLLGQSQQPRLGTASSWQSNSGGQPRQKTITEQMQLVHDKWNPQSPNCVFQYYFYNNVGKDNAPFYRPGPDDDEVKWEEALAKKPSPGAIPVLGKGFFTLGQRLMVQVKHLNILQARLHEINNSLTAMIQNHDLVISIRAADARRKHMALSQRCLALATKVQILRNRGYAMDGAEEELKKKLLLLERNVFDQALAGRGEEIWARMVGVRERTRLLQEELEKTGKSKVDGQQDVIDEGTIKLAAKILDDYSAQLAHLQKELTAIEKDFTEGEAGLKATANGSLKLR